MKVVVALGGNALLRRDQPPTADNQLANIRRAAAQLARVAAQHDLVLTHGNGPQVGLLALQHQALGQHNRLAVALEPLACGWVVAVLCGLVVTACVLLLARLPYRAKAALR